MSDVAKLTAKAEAEMRELTAAIDQADDEATRLREKRKKRVQFFYDRGVVLSKMSDACGFSREWALRKDLAVKPKVKANA